MLQKSAIWRGFLLNSDILCLISARAARTRIAQFEPKQKINIADALVCIGATVDLHLPIEIKHGLSTFFQP